MNRILIIGKTGMLGHVVFRYFEKKGYIVEGTSRNKTNEFYYDVLENYKDIVKIIEKFKPDAVVNCIGVLNKDAEENPDKAILINSFIPHYLDRLSNEYNFKLVHVSTDCVFSGRLGKYDEKSIKDAYSVYGQSKALGEIDNDRNITLRTSIIGPDMNKNGIGLFKWFMSQEGQISGYDRAIWTGVTTIELAKQIEVALKNDLSGLYHVINDKTISKYDLLCLIKKVFEKDILINRDSSYVSDKSLVRNRCDFKFDVPSYEVMIEEMKDWIVDNNDIYKDEYVKGKRL